MQTSGGRSTARIVEDPSHSGVWIEADLSGSAWTLDATEKLWRAGKIIREIRDPNSTAAPVRLRVGDRELRLVPYRKFQTAAGRGTAEGFTSFGKDVFLDLPDGAGPPAHAVLGVFVSRGGQTEAGWRLPLRTFVGEGLPVWPGERQQIESGLPEDGVLSFAMAALAADIQGREPEPVTFRILLDGQLLFEEQLTPGVPENIERRRIPLPRQAKESVSWEFAVDGEGALTAFLAPIVTVRRGQHQNEGERNADSRRDVILFLADTYRADNLTLYGGQHGMAPAVDRFAESCARFSKSWAPASWTLPSQVSMFTGVFPGQHGAEDAASGMPGGLTTVAERLAEQGYRTGAITDSLFVSRDYGIDDGFEWFEEYKQRDLARTIRRALAFLDADDGRPTFLFVQTYRTHMPYQRAESDAGFSVEDEQKLIKGCRKLVRWVANRTAPIDPRAIESEEIASLLKLLHRQYLSGVLGLDLGFGEFARELDERRYFDSGFMIFTSDHGEAFLEHNHIVHPGPGFEELIRVPLLIRGPGVEPRTVPAPASLVDLPDTIADMAGIDSVDGWMGESLLGISRFRPVFAFTPGQRKSPVKHLVVIVKRDHKVLMNVLDRERGRGEPVLAFDLGTDPQELGDLVLQGAEWPRKLCDGVADTLVHLLTPIEERAPVYLSNQALEHLRAAGYTGH
ncbi:MAG: sulfatase [Planctomycetota bacterium]